MSGYSLIMGVLAIITISILWIALYEVTGGEGGINSILNNLAGSNEDVIEQNNMVTSIFYYSLFAFIIIIGMYILKTAMDDREKGVYNYA